MNIEKNEKPLLSIVISTRNREEYCIEAIRNILQYKNNDFELIIQDNSDSLQIQKFVSELSDSRLLYNYDKERINSVINMAKPFDLAKGEYLIMIGDDDTILPNIFDVLKWMKKENILAVSTKQMPSFIWNDKNEDSLKLKGKLILFPQKRSKRKYNSSTQLKKLLKNGLISYSSYYLPKAYHGIVKKSVLDKIKEKTGHYIGGLSPDIYLAVSIALLIKEYYVLDFPVSLPGACPKSVSYKGLLNKNTGKLEDSSKLYNRGEYLWDKRIPAIDTSATIWAETALKAFSEIDDLNMDKMFNRKYFITAFKHIHRDLSNSFPEIFKSKENKTSFIYLIYFLFKKYRSKFRSLVWRITRKYKSFDNVNSWDEAIEIYLKNSN